MTPRPLPIEKWNSQSIQYHEFECSKCGMLAQNTFSEPTRTNMLTRELCFTCNFWEEQKIEFAEKHREMTIIDGHVYSPGNRTSGEFRGMAGRRFDIEYIAPSIYAGQRITTFDLWSGSTMPEELQLMFPDTAKFLNGAERVELSGGDIQTCWSPSDNKTEAYPLPQSLRRNDAKS
jgi:hypothetical protein